MILDDEFLDDEMNELLDKIAFHPKTKEILADNDPTENDDKRFVLEDSDLYGFSSMHLSIDDGEIPADFIDQLKKDPNWNNPAALSLMLKSFGIKDEYRYLRVCGHVKPEDDYRYKKAQYYHLKATKCIDEAQIFLKRNEISKAIEQLTQAIRYEEDNADAYFIRANAYIRLQDWDYVEKDILKAKELNPSCPATQKLYEDVQAILSVKRPLTSPVVLVDTASIPQPSLPNPFPSSSVLSVTSANPLTEDMRIELRQKIQLSLLQDVKVGKKSEREGGESDTNSEDDSSEGSSGSDRSQKKQKKKHKHKKHKHKKKKHKHKHHKSSKQE